MKLSILKFLAALGLTAISAAAVHAQDVTIGAVLPLTGPSASIGEDQRRGIELWLRPSGRRGLPIRPNCEWR
jgi:branched-chain amino acid transport system substrate-binding protein